MQNEKEQEMMSPVNPTEATPTSQRDMVPSLEILDTEFNSRPIGKYLHQFHFDFLLSSMTYISFHCDRISLFHETHPVFGFLLLCVCVSQKGKGPVKMWAKALKHNEYDEQYSRFSRQLNN